jgi:CelD/BcsL family acetyltransferase involved in cellulose biosynthesis
MAGFQATRTARVHGRLDTLADSWRALARYRGIPTVQLAWARSCVEAFEADYELSVVSLDSSAAPRAIAPLVSSRRRGRRLEPIGVSKLYVPTDFLYADHDALAELVDVIVRSGRPLRLGRVLADWPLCKIVAAAYRRRGAVFAQPTGACPYIELHDGWTEPESQLSPRRRSDLRRARRRAEKLGPMRSEVLAPSLDELPPLIEQAFEIEMSGWKGRAGTAIAQHGQLHRFFQTYAKAAAAEGMFRIAFLWIADQVAAMQIGVEVRERFWLVKVGYREEFARCSPGMLLMVPSIRQAAERGLASYEFLGTEEPWIRPWTALSRRCVGISAYPARPRGISAFARDATRVAIRGLTRSGLSRRHERSHSAVG